MEDFDDLYMSNLKGSWKPGNKNGAFGNEGLSFVSAIERMSTLFPTITFSNLLRIEFMFIYEKIIFLGFFDLKFPKWDTFEAINEESCKIINLPIDVSI